MEAMSLVEVVLNNENEDENDETTEHPSDSNKSSPIKGLDESVTITVTRTPGRPVNPQRQTGKPANFAMLSIPKNGRNSDAIRTKPREEMVCNGCDRVFKYKAAFIRHEAQCGLPAALRIERAAIIEAKKAEKAAEIEKRKTEEKPPELRCPTCLKQFYDTDLYKNHDFAACAAERATYTFVCSVCKARFKYKNHMRRHEDSHNNVRRYNCEVCTTAFLRPDHLKRHMMRMHGIVTLPVQSVPEKPKTKPSPYPHADLSSDEQSTRTITKNAPMQCPMCSKVLSRRDHVLRHMRNVHHMTYEPKKRGLVSEYAAQIPGFDMDGLMELDGNGSYNDDEDGSENQSMASHDDLLIDESYESIKEECDSPTPDNYDESEINQEKQTPTGNNLQQTHLMDASKSQIKVKPGSFLYDQNVFTKMQSRSSNELGEFNAGNGDAKVFSETFGGEVTSRAPNQVKNTDKTISSLDPTNSGPIEMNNQISPVARTNNKNSSDGNQNVLSNGHAVAQGSGDDWISNLVSESYSGW